MNFINHNYEESDWRNSSDIEELAERARDERDLADFELSTPCSTGGVFVREDEYMCDAGHCDGSGYFETYVDVDQTRALPCPGCPVCCEEVWPPIDELTSGPIVPEVDATPVAIPPGRQIPVDPAKVA